MTWRNFAAYFDPHIWIRNPDHAYGWCSTCGQTRTRSWLVAHEDALYPVWHLLADGSIRIGD